MEQIALQSAVMPVVKIDMGKPMTDSRDVAAYFEKEHKAVLRSIRDLDCSPDFRQRNFAPFKTKDLTGEYTSHVMMTRDGFTFVAMGFTGVKAAAFKERYIEAFNTMEATAGRSTADTMAILSDPSTLRTLLLASTERELALRDRVEALKPKAVALERIAEASGSLCITDAAKALQVRPGALFAYLRDHRWIYRRPRTTIDRGFETRLQAGLLEHKTTDPDNHGRIWQQVRVTPKGLARLSEELSINQEQKEA